MAYRNLLTTEGAGFIGSNFIPFFLEENDNFNVINLDKITYEGNRENLNKLEKNDRYSLQKEISVMQL